MLCNRAKFKWGLHNTGQDRTMALPKTERFEHHTTWQAYLTFKDYLQTVICILMKTPGIIIKSVSDVWHGDSTSTNNLVTKKKSNLRTCTAQRESCYVLVIAISWWLCKRSFSALKSLNILGVWIILRVMNSFVKSCFSAKVLRNY